jgi:hypothetical protein
MINTEAERDILINELTRTLIILGVTWNPRQVASGLIDKNYRKYNANESEESGTWSYYSTTMMECSVCKRHTARHRFEYCPHCGTKMEGFKV